MSHKAKIIVAKELLKKEGYIVETKESFYEILKFISVNYTPSHVDAGTDISNKKILYIDKRDGNITVIESILDLIQDMREDNVNLFDRC